jgi:hypothetical protein
MKTSLSLWREIVKNDAQFSLHHDGRVATRHGRRLKAQRFTATGRHHHERVAPSKHSLHSSLLQGPQFTKSPVPGYDVRQAALVIAKASGRLLGLIHGTSENTRQRFICPVAGKKWIPYTLLLIKA